MKTFFLFSVLLLCILAGQGCNTIRGEFETASDMRKVKKAALSLKIEEWKETNSDPLTRYRRFRLKQAAEFELERDADFFVRAVVRAAKDVGNEIAPEELAKIRRDVQYAIDHPSYEYREWH